MTNRELVWSLILSAKRLAVEEYENREDQMELTRDLIKTTVEIILERMSETGACNKAVGGNPKFHFVAPSAIVGCGGSDDSDLILFHQGLHAVKTVESTDDTGDDGL